VPPPGLTNEALEAHIEAYKQALAERQPDTSYDESADGGVDPTDAKAMEKATGKNKAGSKATADKAQVNKTQQADQAANKHQG
jgi:hypothetical protein